VAQRVLIEVASAHHVETRGLESLCNQAGVVGWGVKRSCLIAGIPDDERDALLRLCRARHADECQRQETNKSKDELTNPHHDTLKRGKRLQSSSCYKATTLNGL
jgi:hypothetical protein